MKVVSQGAHAALRLARTWRPHLSTRVSEPSRTGTHLSLSAPRRVLQLLEDHQIQPFNDSQERRSSIFEKERGWGVFLCVLRRPVRPDLAIFFFKWESLRNVFLCGRHRQHPCHNAQPRTTETSESLRPPGGIVKNSEVREIIHPFKLFSFFFLHSCRLTARVSCCCRAGKMWSELCDYKVSWLHPHSMSCQVRI